MDDFLLEIARTRGGFAFRSDFIDFGMSDKQIRSAMKDGYLTRLRHGAYAPTSDTDPLSPEQMHALTARALMTRLGDGYVLSHTSAAMVWEPQSFGTDLTTIHVTRRDGRRSRRDADVAFHAGVVTDDDIVMVEGMPVMKPVRAAFESAAFSTTESGLVIVNAMLHAEHCSLEELVDLAEKSERWPGSRVARLAIRLAEPKCESVGESRSIYMFWKGGVPRPDVQVSIPIGDGLPDPRVDYDWFDFRHVGEFDGLFKYGGLGEAADASTAIVNEKVREDRIRSTGRGMSRWVWSDLHPKRRATTAARIRAALENSRQLYTRNRKHIA